MTAPDEAAQRRAARRRGLQQRQTVIFGGLITALLLIGLVAAAMWSGLLPAPFTRDFTREASTASGGLVQPCPPAGAPIPLGSITANVYNGTDRGGLAGETGDRLGAAGVVVGQRANWPSGTYDGGVRIVAGPLGVPAAYSLARVFPDAVVNLDSTRTDETVDVVLGSGYTDMLGAEAIAQLDPEAPAPAPADCTPLESPAA